MPLSPPTVAKLPAEPERLPSLRAKRESGRGEGEKCTALQARAEQGGDALARETVSGVASAVNREAAKRRQAEPETG